MTDTKAIAAALSAPFPAADVKLKPQAVKNNRALAISYIDARAVMDRLDAVVGVDGWSDAYTVLPGGEVECRLSVRFGEAWVTKADVGGQSEQPDDGDKLKAAFSDALKRAAVKFGVGRYLYRLGGVWMDYDPVKKCIVRGPGRGEVSGDEPSAPLRKVEHLPANPSTQLWDVKDADGNVEYGLPGARVFEMVEAGANPELLWLKPHKTAQAAKTAKDLGFSPARA
jgi:hypothetical protein